uniref:Uncharacterized protein n=1 Tax=Pseudomonas phage Aurca01 TaxID=3138527 RepID=A0AAU6W5Z3_9VIRU
MTRKQRQLRVYTWRGSFAMLALATAWMLASAYASHITQ